MKRSYLFSMFCIFTIVAFAFSCSNSKEKIASPKEKVVAQEQQANNSAGIDIPGIPAEQLAHLWNNCGFVDYIFHDLPFSLSQSETPAIQANLNFISPEAAGKINIADCKAIGREFFQVNGEIVMEADVYYSPGCYYYVFVKDEKPIYANKISPSGMNFYHQITTQISTQ